MVAEISIGEASGLIATGVFLLQLFVPLALPILLAAYIAEKNSVVTWSVLGRFLHTSLWPSILRTDTAAGDGVKRHVSYVGMFQTLALALISLASIVTPLGLYDTVTPQDGVQLEHFKYMLDPSPFGIGTPLRSTAPFTRACGTDPCPGTVKSESCVKKGLAEVCSNLTYDRAIPSSLHSLFSDGANSFSPSVSSIFDIQWRSYFNATDAFGKLGWSLRSTYRQITTLILEPDVHVVEGVLVNTNSSGIGFRNHTVPSTTYAYGSKWSEDLLFIEPETQCVDLNFTFNFRLKEDRGLPLLSDVYIEDNGGFWNLSREAPVPTLSTPWAYNGQGDIDLRSRAYHAAWLNNYLTMLYYNLTNPDMKNITRVDSTPGMHIPANATLNSTFVLLYQSIRSSKTFGEYLSFSRNDTKGKNPYNVSGNHFSQMSQQCRGTLFMDPANVNSTLITCGLVYGAARRTDQGNSLVPDPGSRWMIPVYSCASSIKASIQTVGFQYNGTDLSALKVESVEPKKYASPSDMPLWAVENMHNLTIGNAQPLWGVLGTANTTVDDSIKRNVTTITQETLRLPGLSDDLTLLLTGSLTDKSRDGQNLPGIGFYAQALDNAYGIARPGVTAYGDYSGQTSLALFAKWQLLSRNVVDAAQIINLVWTDVAANAVVGTKGWSLTSVAAGLSKRATDGVKSDLVPVTVFRKQVRYRVPFAVPAFVVLAVAVAILVAVIVLLATGRTGLGTLRRLLDATSPGRLISQSLWPEEASGLNTGDWVKRIGPRKVVVTKAVVTAAESGPSAEHPAPEPGFVEQKQSLLAGKDTPVTSVSTKTID
ncbi:alpha-L-fucosidase [Purpureocillium lavendulum]|uniref:Alpha-L-fucosidase n=1 Tax=Purpureocillium lavendulum TaxID=1247861 RepID=A0AB34FV46_9HYPO|nr:alpha-L-fucosidase [Purpureocillium lavendulum]